MRGKLSQVIFLMFKDRNLFGMILVYEAKRGGMTKLTPKVFGNGIIL